MKLCSKLELHSLCYNISAVERKEEEAHIEYHYLPADIYWFMSWVHSIDYLHLLWLLLMWYFKKSYQTVIIKSVGN